MGLFVMQMLVLLVPVIVPLVLLPMMRLLAVAEIFVGMRPVVPAAEKPVTRNICDSFICKYPPVYTREDKI